MRLIRRVPKTWILIYIYIYAHVRVLVRVVRPAQENKYHVVDCVDWNVNLDLAKIKLSYLSPQRRWKTIISIEESRGTSPLQSKALGERRQKCVEQVSTPHLNGDLISFNVSHIFTMKFSTSYTGKNANYVVKSRLYHYFSSRQSEHEHSENWQLGKLPTVIWESELRL